MKEFANKLCKKKNSRVELKLWSPAYQDCTITKKYQKWRVDGKTQRNKQKSWRLILKNWEKRLEFQAHWIFEWKQKSKTFWTWIKIKTSLKTNYWESWWWNEQKKRAYLIDVKENNLRWKENLKRNDRQGEKGKRKKKDKVTFFPLFAAFNQ